MNYKAFSPILAILMMVGAFVMISCSNDDEKSAESAQTQETVQLLQQYNNTVATLNEGMSGLDFKDLAPLAQALSEDDNQDATRQKFNAWLQQLLQLLNRDFKHTIPYGFTIGFEAVENVLSTTCSLSGVQSFGQESGISMIEISDGIVLSTTYKAKDGSEYLVTLEQKADRSLKNLALNYDKEFKLTITKDGETLFGIRTAKENTAMVMNLLPSLKMTHTGEITYKTYVVSLSFSHAIAHDRTVELSVINGGTCMVKVKNNVTDNVTLLDLLKHDAVFTSNFNISLVEDLITAVGKVNNINKFINQSVLLLALRKTGTTEEKCNELAALFNLNMTLNLSVAGTDAGNIKVAPVLDEKLGKYVPSFLIYSPLFGDEPIDINTMLSNFGISIDDILDLMKNKIG